MQARSYHVFVCALATPLLHTPFSLKHNHRAMASAAAALVAGAAAPPPAAEGKGAEKPHLDGVLEGLLSLRSLALPPNAAPAAILLTPAAAAAAASQVEETGAAAVVVVGPPVPLAPLLGGTSAHPFLHQAASGGAPAEAGGGHAPMHAAPPAGGTSSSSYMRASLPFYSALPQPPSSSAMSSSSSSTSSARSLKRAHATSGPNRPSPAPPLGAVAVARAAKAVAVAAAGARESEKIQAEKILVNIPTDSLDPSAVIASDPAHARRLAVTAANAASVATTMGSCAEEGEDGLQLIINQQVAMVPSQTSAVLSMNQESRVKNLERIPPETVRALEAKLSAIPAWGVRITKEKLEVLGGLTLGSPVLMEGERSENVAAYAPKDYHIKCQHCAKSFTGKNALRNFELHAIFWALYFAHPAITRALPLAEQEEVLMKGASVDSSNSSTCSTGSASNNSGAVKAAAQVLHGHHPLNYPCNSISRDVVVFMEARKPVLCNNQKKMFMLRGNLHHDTSLFQGRAWLQIPASKTWESCKLADPHSLQEVLWCRGGKALEAYETLRSHIFAWHDSGVFTSCGHCNRVYQNTRAFLGHGCIKKSPVALDPQDDTAVVSCSQSMWSFLEVSPDFAKLFYQLQALPTERKEEVFNRVAKRLRSTTNV